MAYQVLARKWRPQTFAEVVGQEHISRTLKNAIVQNRIGHAYLFVGSRGIGKTTTARIFAKALNCPNNHDGEPCCKCESCLEVANGSSMDVIEIDGASHNKVEDIRDIRDNVQYAPAKGRFKIYIIDEVHMLTTQAWNALLKTLEEPPEHVKFLFATTEPHKVLPTIISRCQRFDLKRLSVPLIVSRLKQIAAGENISIEDEALAAIARAADGGMRDAQSIFDQIIAFCGGNGQDEMIREQDVIDVFGLASGMELREIAAAIFTNDLDSALRILQKLADSGRDLERLYADLIEYVRNIMVASLCGNAGEILEVSETELADLTGIGKSLDARMVQRVLQELVAQEWSFRAAINKRIYFEATLARVMLEAHSVQLDDIFTHLNRISGTIPQDRLPERPKVTIPPPANPSKPALKAVQTPAIPSAKQEEKTPSEAVKPAPEADKKEPAEPEKPAVYPQPEAQAEKPAVQAAPEIKAEPGPVAQPEPEVQPERPAVQAVPEVKAEPGPEARSEPEVEVQAEPEARSEPEVEVQAQPEPQKAAACNMTAADVCNSALERSSAELVQEEEEQETVLCQAPEQTAVDINSMLMQASSASIDIEDEQDPALASTDASSFQQAYSPESAKDMLVNRLLAVCGENTRPADVIAMLQPQAFGQYGLVLFCDPKTMSPSDMEFVSDSKMQAFFNETFNSMGFPGTLSITFGKNSRGGRLRYKPASFMELRRLADYPAIVRANRILGTVLTDASIPE